MGRIYHLTYASLNDKTQAYAKKYIARIYEAYKELNVRVLFDPEALHPNQHKDLCTQKKYDELWEDLESHTKEVLLPDVENVKFRLPAVRDANKKCSKFYFETMKRIESLKKN